MTSNWATLSENWETTFHLSIHPIDIHLWSILDDCVLMADWGVESLYNIKFESHCLLLLIKCNLLGIYENTFLVTIFIPPFIVIPNTICAFHFIVWITRIVPVLTHDEIPMNIIVLYLIQSKCKPMTALIIISPLTHINIFQ